MACEIVHEVDLIRRIRKFPFGLIHFWAFLEDLGFNHNFIQFKLGTAVFCCLVDPVFVE